MLAPSNQTRQWIIRNMELTRASCGQPAGVGVYTAANGSANKPQLLIVPFIVLPRPLQTAQARRQPIHKLLPPTTIRHHLPRRHG